MVPDGATAIVANVTIVSPTTAGFVAVRPATANGNPTTSSINAAAAGVISPNSVTVELPTAGATVGQIQLWFQGIDATATSQLLVDIVGYYQAGAGGAAGPAGPAGPTGLSYVGTFATSATATINSTITGAPAGYTGTFSLGAGRHLVTGDLTVSNGSPSSSGLVYCYTYVGEVAVGSPRITEVGPATTSSGLAVLPFSDTFVINTPASTTVSFRCYREGGSSSLVYWFANMTVFKVG